MNKAGLILSTTYLDVGITFKSRGPDKVAAELEGYPQFRVEDKKFSMT